MTAGPTTRSWSRPSGPRSRNGSPRCARACCGSRAHPSPRQLVAGPVPRRAHRQGVGPDARPGRRRRRGAPGRGPARCAQGRPADRPQGPRRRAARRRRGHQPRRCPARSGRSATTSSPRSSPPWTPRAPATTRSTCPRLAEEEDEPSRRRRLRGRAAATRSGSRPDGCTTWSTSSARPSWTSAGSPRHGPRARRRWPPTSPASRARRSARSLAGSSAEQPRAGRPARAGRARRPARRSHPRAAGPGRGRAGPARRRPRRRDGPGDGAAAPGGRRLPAAGPRARRRRALRRPQGRRAWSSTARTSSWTPACSTPSPTRCATWSPTPSTTAARPPPSASPPASRRRRRSPSRRGPPARPSSSRSSDDGRGIDEDAAARASPSSAVCCRPTRPPTGPALLHVLFAPGFSTRDEVTQTSGRGVGLDVVRTVVEDLSGTIEVRAEHGVGTTLRHHACR